MYFNVLLAYQALLVGIKNVCNKPFIVHNSEYRFRFADFIFFLFQRKKTFMSPQSFLQQLIRIGGN